VILGVLKQIFEPAQANIRGWSAAVRLGLVVSLIAIGLALAWAPAADRAPLAPDTGDVALYEAIVADMQSGNGYYDAAVDEARERGYPLRPFMTVRLPTLAWTLAALGQDWLQRLAVAALAFAGIVLWALRFARARTSPLLFGVAVLALMLGQTAAFVPGGAWLHEVWAGALIAISLALRTPERWALAVVVGTVAALFRELAAPYLVVMAVMALAERRYKEAGAWAFGLAVFVAALAAHASAVGALVLPTDRASPGWLALGGWSFVLNSAYWSLSVLHLGAFTVLLLPLALLGLTARPLDYRLTLTVFGYIAAFLIVGRSDTPYWGFIYAPLWPIGLVMLWPALVQCRDDLKMLRGRVEFRERGVS
jgi:hypothetical protein